jgi:predicted RNA binding protein YcfA (HicA-like mRNA interferase family)
MSKIEKLISKLLNAKTDQSFQDVKKFLQHFGYSVKRIKGSHHIFDSKHGGPISIPVHNSTVKRIYIKKILYHLKLTP